MTKLLTVTILFSVATVAYAQTGGVGINTSQPKSNLDVNGRKDGSGNLLTTDVTGLQAPRLTRAELTSKGNALYGADQKGTLVYITDISGGDVAGQRVNMTTTGYYYFDGTLWVKIGIYSVSNTFTPATSLLSTTVNEVTGVTVDLTSLKVEPWMKQTAPGTQATSNTEAIYQIGKVAIGQNAMFGTPGTEMLAVNGTIRTASNVYADYVFEDYFKGQSDIKADYKFKTLKEVEDYIKTYNHLPGVTSIKDLLKTKEGYSFNLTDLSVQSLEKLEELYLHVIEQQKQIEAKNAEIQTMKKNTDDLKERVERLEKLLLNDKNY